MKMAELLVMKMYTFTLKFSSSNFISNCAEKEVCMLNDKVDQQRLQLQKSDDMTSMDEMFFLDDTKVISHHYDYVIRVFDYLQGKFVFRQERRWYCG